ncbi:hypothetical protein T02_15821 [Trichinella nativa]|uniref:Uncharacterized protein n=1 Tax=Trichinella nativa TaxID=6335 RepID=A0A0V1LG74_9BILA|nr:hypothetical protein T02_15821 [Trichinella nativa]
MSDTLVLFYTLVCTPVEKSTIGLGNKCMRPWITSHAMPPISVWCRAVPIAFASRLLTNTEKRYAAIEEEARGNFFGESKFA